jgi:hypothetical protein
MSYKQNVHQQRNLKLKYAQQMYLGYKYTQHNNGKSKALLY